MNYLDFLIKSYSHLSLEELFKKQKEADEFYTWKNTTVPTDMRTAVRMCLQARAKDDSTVYKKWREYEQARVH